MEKYFMEDFFNREKIAARKYLNSLPPKQAQELVNRILGADDLQPNLAEELDWDEIPIPSTYRQNGQKNP